MMIEKNLNFIANFCYCCGQMVCGRTVCHGYQYVCQHFPAVHEMS